MKKITILLLFYLFVFTNNSLLAQLPSNNTIANATKITSLPFTDNNVNIPGSNTGNASGLSGCNISNRSVVYKFTPIVSGTVICRIVSPSGTSGTITTIAANENATSASDLSGTPDGNICNNANPKTVNVTSGQTYYFIALSASTTDIEFTGTAVLELVTPSILTTNASLITVNSANLGGNVTDDNGNTVIERGIIYSITNTEPEIGDNGVIKDTNGSGTGSFSKTISNLSSETTYYYRAYAINSEGTGYGEVKSFTTQGVSTNRITRQNPTIQDLVTNTATFQVTFSKPVQNVDATDFNTNSTGATISNVTAVSTSQYNVTLNNITSFGDVFLQIKGIDGVSGSNDITTATTSNLTTSVDQQNSNDWLNQSTLGQTFTANTDGIVKTITFYPEAGQHTFSGTADLKLYSGVSNDGGTEIDSESVNITSSTDSTGQTLSFATPVNLISGQTYTITLENFSGSGSQALSSHTSNQYDDGHVIFAGMNSSSHLNFDLKIKIIEETTTPGGIALSTTAPAINQKYVKTQTTGVPFLTTADATSITKNSATLGGEILSQGDSPVTERGVVFSIISSFPVIGDSGANKMINSSETNTFSEAISNLDTKNIYFYRTYATNAQGTGYGKVKRFSLNNALAFRGDDDRVEIPNYNYTNGFSFDALLKPVTFSGNPTFLSRHGSSNTVFAFIIKSDGTVECTISTNGTTETYFTTTASLALDTWQHVAFTYNNSDGAMKFYINGTDAGSGGVTNATTGSLFNSSNVIQIGARNSSLHYEGAMDELRIWNKTLSSTFINEIKNKVVPKNTGGLLAYYQFNQGIAGAFNGGFPNLITKVFNTKTGTLDGDLVNFSMNGTTSNFIEGATGDFDNNIIAQNKFTATGNWSDANNWSFGIVPSKLERAVISQNQTVTIDVDDLEIDDFELEANATLDIPKDKEITINNNFTSNGNLALESDKNDSGVLLLNGTTSGTVTYKRGGLLANKWSIVTPPVSGQTVKTFAENASNDIRTNTSVSPTRYAIGYYDDAQAAGSKWQYYDANVNAATEFVAGQSYIVSRATDGEVTFTGTLTADNVFKTLVADQWNAIGNPFTTYYPANKNSSSSFLNDNMGALDDSYKSLYLWDNAQNKYVAVTEVDATDRSLPPGQGFFVRMKTGQTEINFQEAKRSTKPASGTTTFAKSVTPEIVISLSDEKNSVKTNIKYFAKATIGLDPGYDIGNFDSANFDVFTKLVDGSNSKNFTIQSLPLNQFEDVVIPVGIVAQKGKNINLNIEKLHFSNKVHVYLEDKLKNIFLEINEKNISYSSTLENDNNGIGRFFIHTSSKVLHTNPLQQINTVSIFKNNNTLNINGLKSEKSTITLYSLTGKKIHQIKLLSGGNHKINLPKLTTGIYVVKLENKNGQLTQKIIIH